MHKEKIIVIGIIVLTVTILFTLRPSPTGMAIGGKSAEKTIELVHDLYDAEIKQVSQKNGIPDTLLAAVIAQESSGVSNADSGSGCKGLLQFCSGTAVEYKQFFPCVCSTKQCYCNGDSCSTTDPCSPQTDDRLKPIPSIEAGGLYLKRLLTKYKGSGSPKEYGLAFYNGGAIVDLARKNAATAGKPDNWKEVLPFIDANAVLYSYCKGDPSKCSSYFDTEYERANKAKETRNYVGNVLAWQTLYAKKYGGESGGEYSGVQPGVETSTPVVVGGEEGEEQGDYTIGTYSVQPSFKVSSPFNTKRYEQLVANAQNLLDICQDSSTDPEHCVADNTDKLITEGTTPAPYCNSVQQEIGTRLAETYEQCSESSDRDCSCAFSVPNIPPGDEMSSIMQLEQDGTGIQLSYDGSSQTDYIDVEGPYYIKTYPDRDEIPATAIITVMYGADGKPKSTDLDYEWYLEKAVPENKLLLYKDFKGDVSVIEPGTYSRFSSLKQCKTTQRYFRFCFKDNIQTAIAYDPALGKSALQPVYYKFALYVPDNIPPKQVTGVVVEDKQYAQQSLIASWRQNEEKDLSHYNIYCSLQSFTTVDDITPVYRVTPLYTNTTLKISVDKCRISKETVLPLQDDTPYFVAVTAVDMDGNENPLVVPAQATSLDNLAPGPAGSALFGNDAPQESTLQGGVFVYILKPEQVATIAFIPELTTNEDGSPLNDFKQFVVCLFTYPPVYSSQGRCTPWTQNMQVQGQESSESYVAVLGEDKHGNVIQDLSKTYTQMTEGFSQWKEVDGQILKQEYAPNTDSVGVQI